MLWHLKSFRDLNGVRKMLVKGYEWGRTKTPTAHPDRRRAGARVCGTHAQAPPGRHEGGRPEPPRALGQAPARSSAAPLTKNWSIVSEKWARTTAAAPKAVGTCLPRRDGRRPRPTSGSRPAPRLPPCFTRKLFLAPPPSGAPGDYLLNCEVARGRCGPVGESPKAQARLEALNIQILEPSPQIPLL